MIAVDQTIFGLGKGNCFAACVASIFEVPLDSLPNFCCEEGWPANFEDWLHERGLARMTVNTAGGGRVPFHAWGIATGPSPRGDFLHSCVYRGDRMVHDPHPSRDGLLCLKEIDTFVVLDPGLREGDRTLDGLGVQSPLAGG